MLRNRDVLAKSRGQPRLVELYNLEADVAETKDVAAQNPEVVQRLRTALDAAVARGSLCGSPGANNDTAERTNGVSPFDVRDEKRGRELS